MDIKSYLSMVGTMFKIGSIGFGGGSALIPVIEEEVVERNKIVTEEEFNSDVVIASITPGALPVEIATGIGYQTHGNRGMVAAATAMAFPGAFLTLLLLILVSSSGNMFRTQLGFFAVGISTFIILTLIMYVKGTLVQACSNREKMVYLFMILAVFLLSGEKNIYQLFGWNMTPIFGISTIQILGTAFFIIFFTKGKLRYLPRAIPACVIALIYFLCVGRRHIIPEQFKERIIVFMVILAIVGFIQSIHESHHRAQTATVKLTKTFAAWLIFVAIFSIPAIIMNYKTIQFMAMGFVSSAMSFGGGDAYLSVAQGLFVDNGMISYTEFFGDIVSIANALPGSILCKILTGIGYILGYNQNGSVMQGIAVGVCGFACSVAASGLIFQVIRAIYEKYENLLIFIVVKHFIRPIISGLLLNVAVSLYISGIQGQMILNPTWFPGSMLILAIIIAGIIVYLDKKKNIHLLWKIIISGGLSLIICNLLCLVL